MNYEFRYKSSPKDVSPHYAHLVTTLTSYLNQTTPISTPQEYSTLISDVVDLIRKEVGTFSEPLEVFDREIKEIKNNAALSFQDPQVNPTDWGGVVHIVIDKEGRYIKDINKRVEKDLVIEQFGVLGFESHERKDETLVVKEGVVLFIYSSHQADDWKSGSVSMTLAEQGSSLHLLVGDEHGMIAVTNAVVTETSNYALNDIKFYLR